MKTTEIVPKRKVPAPARMFYFIGALWVVCYFWEHLTSALSTASVLTLIILFVYAVIPFLDRD
jgi:hypothetical protein